MNKTAENLQSLLESLSFEVVLELLEIFDKQYREGRDQFRLFAHHHQNDGIAALAHTLKSSAASLGAQEMAALLQKIEKHPKEYLNTANLSQLDQYYLSFKELSKDWINDR